MAEIAADNFADYFYRRFELNNRWQGFGPAAKFLNTLKANQRFHLLFAILQDHHARSYEYQKVAAGLMLKVDARCPLRVSDAVVPVLNTLDLSIPEYPFFLAKRYGREMVLAELAAMDGMELNESQRKRLETLIYWVRGFTEARYEDLRALWSARIRG